MSGSLFYALCSTLEIRDNSQADRDRKLYQDFCSRLGMAPLKPKAFFAAHPEVTEVTVLAAFLDVLEPFARMVEEIFQACSHAPSGASGGNNLTIAYDTQAESLRFDLDAYRRFREVLREVRVPTVMPRYHDDFVVSYAYALEELAELSTAGAAGAGAHASMTAPGDLLDRARAVGEAHIRLLDDLREDGGSLVTAAEARGITTYPYGFREDNDARWRDPIQRGLSALDSIRGDVLSQPRMAGQATRPVERLEHALGYIAEERDAAAIQRALEQFLELPYWKKRWQVYEVWVVAAWLDAVFAAGGAAVLDPSGQMRLHTGSNSQPLALLRLADHVALELWMEFPIAGGSLRPDVVLVMRYGSARIPVHFTECKQRAGAGTRQMWRAARKYLPSMPPGTTHLVVNYDVPTGAGDHVSTDREGRTLASVADVCPGGAGEAHLRQVIANAIPILRPSAAPAAEQTVWVAIVDTTRSMHRHLPDVQQRLDELTGCPLSRLLLILYGDHDDAYTATLHADITDVQALYGILDHIPTTSGGDVPEALEDAVYLARTELDRRGILKARVVVFTDAPAHSRDECPHRHDFAREVRDLVARGCTVSLVACGVRNVLDWNQLNDVADLQTLDGHSWLAA